MLGFEAVGVLALGQIEGGQTLSPALFSDGDVFSTATLKLYLTPSLFADADTFFTPSLSFKIYPSLFTDGDTFNTHIIGVEQFLFPTHFVERAYVAKVRQI